MQTAVSRALAVVPPTTLDEFRGITLRVYHPDCDHCSTFDHLAYEQRWPSTTVLPWDCSNDALKRLAMDAGVTELPAYLCVADDGTCEVVRPVTAPTHAARPASSTDTRPLQSTA